MKRLNYKFKISAFIAIFFFAVISVHADEFTSASFISSHPVLAPAAFSSSGSFRLLSTISQVAIGTSTATSFGLNTGFLYFPFVTSPVLSATAGVEKVDLTWTGSDGFLGLTPSTYSVGQSLVSGGPYTLTNVGNVLTSSRTSLTGGTEYFFIVKALDSLNDTIATSSEVSATPTSPAPSPTPPPPSPSPSPGAASGGGSSGGGGGGSGVSPSPTPATATLAKATFKGRAYPLSKVTVLKDGQIAITTIAGPDANFEVTLSNLNTGNYVFGIYSADNSNRKSSIFTFPIFITDGASAVISGIFITPTIDVDKLEVKRGDNIAILGQSIPKSEVVIAINSEIELFAKTNADKDGAYLYNLDTSPLEIGDHTAKSKSASEGLISSFGQAVGFKVGTKNLLKGAIKQLPAKGDVNGDGKVNLVDFSIVAFWWKRVLPVDVKNNIDSKLWPDGSITLRDFSIMAFYWTG
ncbi:MAG: hypothetical protein Q7S19_01160 [bacterium]|nr:hypothetical protein [bacterium]